MCPHISLERVNYSCFIILEQAWSNQKNSQSSLLYILGKDLKIIYLKWGHIFSIWIFETQVKWPIEWSAIKLTIRLVIIRMSNKRVKPFSIWEIDSFLERSFQKLQFSPWKLLNQNPYQGIMNPQNIKIHTLTILKCEFQNFVPFQCNPCHKI
jgi:hypothetical protein